ncbi:hypothetical protein LZ554_009120 [Drepanopeziza brunnea f. sp. 'monogermtubi']|nr:hypothetical protein LZ554_009120 [Drepanopeziza brunnea f. sp. 'monogermtubi']
MFTIKALVALLFISAASAQLYSCTCGGNHAQTKSACDRLPDGRMSGNEGFYRCMVSNVAARDEFLSRSCTLKDMECYEDNQPWNCYCGVNYAQTEAACDRTHVGKMTGKPGRRNVGYSCYFDDANGRELFMTDACIIPGRHCSPIKKE